MKQYKYKPLKYFALTFIFTWLLWFLSVYLLKIDNLKDIAIIPVIIGLFIPSVLAVSMIFSSKNKELRQNFYNKLLSFKSIKLKTIPFIIFMPAITIIISILVSKLFGYSMDQFTISEKISFQIGSIPTLLVLFLSAVLEELGWRGYGNESLNSKYNYLKTTLIFGILWSLWHLPLVFIENTYQNELIQLGFIYVLNFFISIIPLAFVISWVCKTNKNNILSAIIFHFIINISQEFFMIEPFTKCIQTIVMFCFAVFVIILNKNIFLEKNN